MKGIFFSRIKAQQLKSFQQSDDFDEDYVYSYQSSRL